VALVHALHSIMSSSVLYLGGEAFFPTDVGAVVATPFLFLPAVAMTNLNDYQCLQKTS
jgi:hypothetical protein